MIQLFPAVAVYEIHFFLWSARIRLACFFHKTSPSNSLQKKPLGKNINIVKVDDVKSHQGTNLSWISFRYYIIYWYERSLISPSCTSLFFCIFDYAFNSPHRSLVVGACGSGSSLNIGVLPEVNFWLSNQNQMLNLLAESIWKFSLDMHSTVRHVSCKQVLQPTMCSLLVKLVIDERGVLIYQL